MGALVLEGGTFRPIFSSGVMDALLDYDIEFPYIIGVSAGITDGVSYVSKQKKRNYDILVNHRHDKRYVGFRNYFTDKSLFGLKFAYERIPDELYPFDWETFLNSKTTIKIGVTNAKTGKAEYHDGQKTERKNLILRATCAIPLVFPVIKVNGGEYYDGGICDPIPVRQAQNDGNEKMLIVLTRTKGYKKDLSKANVFAAKVLGRKYPKLVKPLLERHNIYNEGVEYCEQLEKEGKALILRPDESVQIDSFEKDIEKIKRVYQYGYDLAVENIDAIREIANHKGCGDA